MECYHNWHHVPALIFTPGDKVYLDASDIQTTHLLKKLAHRQLGPYIVEHQVGSHAYCLWLPKSMSQLHPVFPVVKFTSALEDPIPGHHTLPSPQPVLLDGEEHFEVESVLDSHMWMGQLQFLIKWKGYIYEENSQENEGNVNAPDLITEFYNLHPGAPWCICSFGMIDFHRLQPVSLVGIHVLGHHILDGGWCEGSCCFPCVWMISWWSEGLQSRSEVFTPCLTLFPHLGTPIAWSFGFQPYGVAMPEAHRYIVSS